MASWRLSLASANHVMLEGLDFAEAFTLQACPVSHRPGHALVYM